MRIAGKTQDFAGVALVDILANGVAVLIIIIVLSISSRFEEEQRQLEQVDEVAAMLSRQFTTSIVMNRLAASKPARLHDYENSPLDRVKDFRIMPILELHRDFARDYYSGTIFLRRELLLEHNRMDEWFDDFTPHQRRRIRVDIYDIRQFYLTHSIMKSHGIVPRHWHFLAGGGAGVADAGLCPPGTPGGECQGLGGGDGTDLAALTGSGDGQQPGEGAGGEGTGNDAEAASGKSGDSASAVDGGNGTSSGSEQGSQGGSGKAGQNHSANMPVGGELSTSGGLDEDSFQRYQNYPEAPAARFGSQQGRSGGRGGPSDAADAAFENLARGMGRSDTALGQGDQLRPRRATFRLPTEQGQREQQNRPNPGEEGQQQANYGGRTMPPLRQVIGILMHYMRTLQQTVDEGGSPQPIMATFKRFLREAFSNPPKVRPEDVPMADRLVADFSAYWPDDTAPKVLLEQNISMPEKILAVRPNAVIDELAVLGNATQEPDIGVPGELRPKLQINLYPGIFRGLYKELPLNSVLLMPPEQQHPHEFRWRAVTYIAPAFDDFITGFVYSAVDDQGRLLLEVDSNRVKLNGRSLRSLYPASDFDIGDWLTLLYSMMIAGLLLLAWLGLRSLKPTAAG